MEEKIKRIKVETCENEKVKPASGVREEEEEEEEEEPPEIRDALTGGVEKGSFYLRRGQLWLPGNRFVMWTEIHLSSVSHLHICPHCPLLNVHQQGGPSQQSGGPAGRPGGPDDLVSAPPPTVWGTGHARTRL